MKKEIFVGLTTLFAVSGCAEVPNNPPQTQLQMREFQTRIFDTNNKSEVLSAVIEALQDEGFMVKNVVPDVGLISAVRESDVENRTNAVMSTIMFGANAVWSKNVVLDATANVKTSGKKTKVRLTFQEKTLNNRGTSEDVRFIDNPVFYQNMFNKVNKSLFIENQKL